TNEESGFRGIKWYAANEEAPVAGFTPDIPEGIVHAEKGGLHIRIDIPVGVNDAARLVSFQAGEAVNIVPDRCEAVFRGENATLQAWADVLRGAVGTIPLGGEVLFEKGAITVRAFGRAAHASLPENGENAIAALCRLIDANPPPGGAFEVFSILSDLLEDPRFGSSLGIAMSDDVSGPLTCNPGLASFSRGILSVALDIRHPVTIKGDLVAERLRERLASLGLVPVETSRYSPLLIPKDSPLIRDLSEAFYEVTGKYPEVMAIGGGTYAKALPNVVAFAPFPSGLLDLAHQADEHIGIEDLLSSVLVLKAAMLKLAR
ncbi:MAG: M20 family metallopeptidase, partial [Thermovirga sp.]|nr:M20 family metallopeptidase [Thermovirga sp.]